MLSATSNPASGVARWSTRFVASALMLFGLTTPLAVHGADKPFLPPPPPTVSTVPYTGDINPYGVVFVPDIQSQSSVLHAGDLLVSNFNNAQNLQGLGTSIVRIDGNGQQSLFYQSGIFTGLSAALGILHDGTVIVGNLPTLDGTSATALPGALEIINPSGTLMNILQDRTIINGPWGLALNESSNGVQVFISNILNGTVSRLTYQRGKAGLALSNATVIAVGLNHRGDAAALELGPSGLLYDATQDMLYMASSADNAIYKFANVSTVGAAQASPILVVSDFVHLHGPLDLAFTPNGHLLVANSDGLNVDPNQPSEIAEYTTNGAFVTQFSVDPNNGGAFGIAIQHIGRFTRFAAVDDNTSTVTIWTKLDQ